MGDGMFSGIGDGLLVMMWLFLLFVPLGMWKAAEIILWIFKHASVGIE